MTIPHHIPRSIIVITLLGCLLCAGSAGASVDPERNASTPTGWHWWRGQSAAKLDQLAADNGERVVSISVDDPIAERFTAAMVSNTGVYHRDGGWFHDKTRDQVVALTQGKDRRLIDLEPYVRSGKLRFAGVTVPNTGASAKSWWWNYDLTADQVTHDINQHKIRLVDLDVYVRDGKRRFAYVGIKNTGEDAKAWWWYFNVTPDFVQHKAEQNGARLIDIEPHQKGRLTVVMVRNDEHMFSRHAYGVTQTWLNNYVQSQGVRITDLRRIGDRYYATMNDNVDAETGRIRSIILASPYSTGYFGAFAKKVGGSTYVGLAHGAKYQPMSTMKLVPHLYVMDKLDKQPGLLDKPNEITWSYFGDDVENQWCPDSGQTKQTKSTTLRDTLTQGLGISLNTAHEALLNKYTPEAITARMHDSDIGLNQTDMYYGCKHTGKKDWTSSRTTLTDIGELFEGVETRKFFPQHWSSTRDEFYGLMASWDTSALRAVVADEAAKVGKSSVVDSFMSSVEIKGKGGGVNGTLDGRSLSYRVTIPVKAKFRGVPVTLKQSHVGGFFVNDMPEVCNEDVAHADWDNQTKACQSYITGIDDVFSKLTAEMHRTAIREALKSW
jgi:beta-lactamase family protein